MAGWTNDPRALNTGSRLQQLINLEWGASAQDWLALGASGLWDCVPVGHILPAGTRTWQRRQILVLRLLPGVELEDCPLALACPGHGESSIIAANLEELLPSYLYERLYLDESGLVRELRRCEAGDWATVGARWGVVPARLERIRESLEDETVRRALSAEPGFEARTEGIQALAGWVDGLPRAAVVRYVLAERLDLAWEPPDRDAAGAWRETLALFAAVQVGERVPEPALREARLRALRVPMPHEAAYMSADLYVGPCLGTAWTTCSLHQEIATEVLHELEAGGGGTQDALTRAAAGLARTGPAAYDGQLHLDAASALAAAGDMEGSLSALLTAVSWQRARYGAPLATSLHAWVRGTAEAGPAWQRHYELAYQMREILVATGRPLLIEPA